MFKTQAKMFKTQIKMYTKISENQAPINETSLKQPIRLDEEGLYILLTSRSASKRERAISYIIQQLLHHNRFFESEQTIAERMGMSRVQVSRIVQILISLGVISRKRRLNNSNIYSINPEMKTPTIVERFGGLIPSLRGILHLGLLLSLSVGMSWCKPRPETTKLENVTLNIKEDKCINILTSKDIIGPQVKQRLLKNNTAKEGQPRVPVRVSRLDLIENSKLRDIYPTLDIFGQYLAVNASMAPWEACYLALYPKEILRKACITVMMFYKEQKETIHNKKAFIINAINMISKQDGFTPDGSYINTIRYFSGADSHWDKLTWQEQSLLLRKLKNITMVFEGQYEVYRQQQKALKEQELAKKQAVIRRDNPYSTSFVGCLDPRESLKLTRSYASKNSLSEQAPQTIAPQPPTSPSAPGPVKKNVFLDMFPCPVSDKQ